MPNCYDFLDLSSLKIPRLVLSQIPEEVARAHSVIPVEIDKSDRLVVAVFDPTNYGDLDAIHSISDRTLKFVVALKTDIVAAIGRHYPIRWE